jgi:hypothetical protein
MLTKRAILSLAIVTVCALSVGLGSGLPPPQSCSCHPPTEGCGGTFYGCYFDYSICECECSPIIIDVGGHGFKLTDPGGGVRFDLNGTGTPQQVAWTVANSEDAFLAIDLNGNGKIDNGTELFGNFSPQPPSDHRNGFIALAQYDKPENGGNGNGLIDAGDSVFHKLLLWEDTNHNGVSERSELHGLADLGLASISLSYEWSYRRDRYGNWFRYRGLVNASSRRNHLQHWAYDVYLAESQ